MSCSLALTPAQKGIFNVFAVLGGGLALLVQSKASAMQSLSFYEFGTYTLMNFDQSMLLALAVNVANGITCSAILFMGGLSFSLFFKKNGAILFFYLMSLVMSIGILTYGVYIQGILSDTQEGVENAASSSVSDQESFEYKVAEFTLALYTGCCAEKRYIDVNDPSELVNYCNGVEPNLNSGQNCYSDEELFARNMLLSSADVCELLEETIVDIEGVLVPGTNILISKFTNGETQIPVVGPSEREFGCGGGLPVAFQLAFVTWFTASVTPLASTARSVGTVLVLLFSAGLLAFFKCPDDEDDTFNNNREIAKQHYLTQADKLKGSPSAPPANFQTVKAERDSVGGSRQPLQQVSTTTTFMQQPQQPQLPVAAPVVNSARLASSARPPRPPKPAVTRPPRPAKPSIAAMKHLKNPEV